MSTTQHTKMNPIKYTEVLKNQSEALNPRMSSTPLMPKPPRVRLTESAKKNLRSIIAGEGMVKSDKPTLQVVPSYERVKSLMELSRPLVLASASAGVLPSFVMDQRRFMQSSVNSAGVRLLAENELSDVVIEG